MTLTDRLAIYGAVLSTGVAIWNILCARSKVDVRIAFFESNGIIISIQNPSRSTVHLTSVSFLYPYESASWRKWLKHLVRFKRIPLSIGWFNSSLSNYNVTDGCPLALEAGKSHLIHIPEIVLRDLVGDSNSKVLKIVVQDALWRNSYSSKFDYSILFS